MKRFRKCAIGEPLADIQRAGATARPVIQASSSDNAPKQPLPSLLLI